VHLRKAPINAEMNIPTPHFLLREPKSKKPTLISCHIRYNRDRIIFSTGQRILPVEWDSSKQRAINNKKYPHNTEINIWLDKVDSEIKSVFRAFNLENISPTPEIIKERIYDKLFNKVNTLGRSREHSKPVPCSIELTRELTVVQAMDELNRVMAIPVKVRKQTIWVRTDIPPNAQNLIKTIGMRIPPKILRKTEM
jgi:hypothetical protein